MGKHKTTEEFIEQIKKVHGDKYDYSKVEYKGALKHITVICPKHGEFKILPSNFLRGSGCKHCVVEKNKKTTEQFIEEARKVHGDKYDYSKTTYINAHTKVEIICPKHGSFWQIPNDHSLYKHGCFLCSQKNNGNTRNLKTIGFIEKARKVHGDKYDYSKVEYINKKTEVCIICSEHGEFFQLPSVHLRGNGCPKCSGLLKKTTKQFIEDAKKVHGDKYDYSKVKYINAKTKVCIICPTHGEFWQSPSAHLRGNGCVKCKGYSTEQFIEEARKVHGDKYDYSKANYSSNTNKVCIICPTHGEFWQRANTHLSGKGCPSCGQILSKNENEIFSLLKEKCDFEIIKNNRNILKGKEIDIFIPEKNIGIEFNGLRWHSELFGRDKWYHLNKTKECNGQGIKLLQIFEDEYICHKEIVLNKIYHILGVDLNLPKIMGRKCNVIEIDKTVAELFLNEFHIQGFACSTIYLGCFYGSTLVGVMTFKKEKQHGYWELNRFASDYHYICQGIGGKLFRYFIKRYNPIEIKSFADRRWTLDENCNLYVKLGFKLSGVLKPEYRYISNSSYNGRKHKFNFRKQILHKKYGLPLSMSESEMTKKLGFSKIWDCGLFKFIWKNE